MFLQQVILKLVDAAHVPPSLWRSMWYQLDGGSSTLRNSHQRKTPQSNLWTTVDRSWWLGLLTCQITESIMHVLLLLWSHEKLGVQDALSFS
ncbi:hypothetical protein TNCV_525741 [Trichonephila clavipes]|nr:hypothetical protein TNCV_525741 [Trichonephila clavipes]